MGGEIPHMLYIIAVQSKIHLYVSVARYIRWTKIPKIEKIGLNSGEWKLFLYHRSSCLICIISSYCHISCCLFKYRDRNTRLKNKRERCTENGHFWNYFKKWPDLILPVFCVKQTLSPDPNKRPFFVTIEWNVTYVASYRISIENQQFKVMVTRYLR